MGATTSSATVGSSSTAVNSLVCAVCGDVASGYHYNALSCEGCKGFFRRTVQRLNNEPVNSTSSIKFQECKYGGNCEIDIFMRRKCPACRLKKCRAVGMLEECLLTDVQCQSKRRRRMEAKLNRMTHQAAKKSRLGVEISEKSSTEIVHQHHPETKINTPEAVAEYSLRLGTENASLIKSIQAAYQLYQIPPDGNAQHTVSLTRRGTIHAEAFVESAKRYPGFRDRLSCDDQITLLKGGAIEAFILRYAHYYQENAKFYSAKLHRLDV